jgi:hypothetical protein
MKKNMMNSICKKVDEIGIGLLRCREKNKTISIQVTAKCLDGDRLECYANSKKDPRMLKNKIVSLIQKHDNDYLYISGLTEKILPGIGGKILSIRIYKACWFVKQSKGTLSWLKEKHVYDLTSRQKLQITS